MKKIAELNGEQYFDFNEIVLPLTADMLDVETVRLTMFGYKGKGKLTDEEIKKISTTGYAQMGALLMGKKHRAATYKLLSILCDKSESEIKSLPAFEIKALVQELLEDGDLLSFFISATPPA